MNNHKDLINTAIHNYYHENTELEMDLKDYFYELESKAQAFDEIVRFIEYQQAYDLTDSMVIQDIDYAIRKVFTEVEQ